jgi:AGCS family alanine or glycine:cation symporter
MAFAAAFPGGDIIVSLGLCLFAFTTMIGWSFYGERCVVFLFGTRAILPFRLAWVLAVPVGTVVKLDLVWLLADTLNAFMADAQPHRAAAAALVFRSCSGSAATISGSPHD